MFLKVVILSFTSYAFLFLLVKLIGNREMSQLSMFDYVISITLGSIAAEMATSLNENYMEPVIAMIVYALLSILLAIGTNKFIKFRRVISGRSLILLDDGKIYRDNFKKAKLDLSEFLIQCRSNGFFNINDLQTVILEANGKMSFIPISLKRPATPEDLNLSPKQEKVLINVILDGHVMEENLKKTGNNTTWLNNELEKQRYTKINDILLATCDSENNLSVYLKLHESNSHDYFQ